MNNFKYFLTLQVLFFLTSSTFAQIEKSGVMINFSDLGDYHLFLQKKYAGPPAVGAPLVGTPAEKVEVEIKHGDVRLGNKITLLEYPDLAREDTMVKNLIDYINLIVDYCNRDQINNNMLDEALTNKWEEDKGRLKYRYRKYTPNVFFHFHARKTNEDNEGVEENFPVIILVNSGHTMGPITPAGSPRTLANSPAPFEGGKPGDRTGHVSVLFATMGGDGKIYAAGGYHPLISEEWCVLLRRTDNGGYVLSTFSYEDWPEKGYDQPSPFYHWDSHGKTLDRKTKHYKFEDFDVVSFLSGRPNLRWY